MSHDRVYSSRLSLAAQRILKSEVSRAFGLWIVAAIVCLVASFLWMSAHYDPNRPALMAAKRDAASAALGSVSDP